MLPDTFTPELLRQLELVKIRARRAFLGTRQGGHVSLKRGHGIEFSDYRRYELGDNPRHIDWGVYARSDRLVVKTFQEEQDLSVLLLLDTSASMFTPATDNKWKRACEIALALAYVALMEQDSVRVAAPGLMDSPLYYGSRAIHELSAEISKIKQASRGNYKLEAQRAVSRMRFPGVAVFISDFLMPPEDAHSIINLMRAKNLDITAIQVLGPSDLNPLEGQADVIAVDSETGELVELSMNRQMRDQYSYLMEEHQKKIEGIFADAAVRSTKAITSQALNEFLVLNLPATGLLK